MRWTELEIVVPAPPEETFPWVVEPGLLREWLPQLDELRPRGFLHHRPTVRHAGVRLALDVRVTSVVVPERVELDVAWRGAAGRSVIEVDPHEDGSLVTWRVGLALPAALRLAGPGVARELRRLMRRDLELLAERLGSPEASLEAPGPAVAEEDPDPVVADEPPVGAAQVLAVDEPDGAEGAADAPDPATVAPGTGIQER